MKSGYIYVSNTIFPTLLAISFDEQSQGLMYQPWPPPIMSFVYSTPQINKFWMSHTPSPLDIVFCCHGQITKICKGEPFSTQIIGDELSDLVIEFPYGTVASTGIHLKNEVGFVSPSEPELKKILASHFY